MGVRGRTRATGAQRTWGPAGARGSTEGQRPRGPLVRARGCVPPRCAGARPPPLCACAGLREVRARGTRQPGCTARTCWRLSTLRRTPCHILRRVGRCVGGGRPATKGRDGGARGRPTSVRGGPGSPASGRGRGAGSPCQASSAGPPATCRRGGPCGERYSTRLGSPPELPPKRGDMWPYPWKHVGTPSHLGHMDRVAATVPSQAHAGAAQEAPDIGQWEGQDVPLLRPSSCNVKGGIPSSRRYLPTYLLPGTVVGRPPRASRPPAPCGGVGKLS